MRKLTTAAAAAAAGIALALSGCSAGSGQDADVAPAKSGTVSWWGYTPDTPVAQRYIAEFNKEYPKIKVTYRNFENVDYRQAIIPALDSGKGPDIFDTSAAGGTPAQYGPYAIDLTSFAKQTLGADWKSKIGANYADQLTDDGQLTAMPLGGQAAGMLWWNKDILDKAGASVPTDYASWVDTCKKITAVGKACFTMGAGGKDTFPTELYHSIANSVDPTWFLKAATGKAKWTDPQGIETLDIIKRMKADGIIAKNVLDGGQYPLADGQFQKSEAASVQMGFWYTQYSGAQSCKTAEESAGVSNPTCFVQVPSAFPDVAGKGNGSAYFGEVDYGLSINADSKNVGAAKTFVRWMTMSKTGQQNVANALDLLPSLQGVQPDWSDITLVDQAVQQPAIEKLITASGSTTQTRQYQTTEKTLDGIVVAIQQILDPTVDKPTQQIASDLQGASEASTVGTK
ncbi:ABC transporter substrate-binding protein [uncultured Amnibacterium sp.]|uniref:ABC transporter substrate-binding protein n=1 Tax=uncultured Amnibacterium sp. TaxID=1631851 RepID=UPI0035C97720